MRYANLLSAFYFQPWCIRKEKHIAMGAVLQHHLKAGTLPEPPRMMPRAEAIVGPAWEDGSPVVEQMQKVGPVAIIPVKGVLGRHLSFLDLWCGGCDYDHIAAMLALAQGDPVIEKIVFDLMTPGGRMVGLFELAQLIAAASKETYAYADSECCSAGYALACQCNEVYFAETAMTTNVGSYMAAIDTSREWEMAGWKLQVFRSGKFKGAGADGKAWTADELAFFQEQAEYAGNKFKALVKSRRTVDDADLEAQWFFGEQAVARGFADGVVNSRDEMISLALVA